MILNSNVVELYLVLANCRAPMGNGAAKGDLVFFNQAISGLKGLPAIKGGRPA
jgi:hypothetical protein